GTPEAQLRALSHERWATLSNRLRSETGIDNGFRMCGGICVGFDEPDQLVEEISAWHTERVPVEEVPAERLVDVAPAISRDVVAAYRLPSLAQVRNPRHLKALVTACRARGVTLQAGARVSEVVIRGGRVAGVRTATETFDARTVCVAGGAWTPELMPPAELPARIVPVRGQIALLSLPAPLFHHVIECGPRYLVPRTDGRVLVGSTQEHVGFDKRNTAGAIAELIDFAVRLVPELANATLERTWAGLRPGTPDGLPYLGAVPAADGLFVAAGHFRAGLQMSPGTAAVMADLMLGETPRISLDGFSPGRIL
ncbi:MAG: NAD(P)/FAD-dependent oxidoreductase, partial [Planctomycetaceae bacterium]